MPFLFANPWGLLALLGIPAVLAIHFLHRQRRTIPVSTLFLIEISREPEQSGRRWHRLLPSIPLWLQLLLVLLITALLAQPYLPQGVMQVAVVVDDSASMMAYRSSLASRMDRLVEELGKDGHKTRWHIYSANPASDVLYSGEDPGQWISQLSRWEPSESWRDPSDSLRLARSRVSDEGVVIYATDTPTEDLPSGVALLAIGHPLDNVGIAGVTTSSEGEVAHWQAVVVNHSDQAATRAWRLEWNGSNSSSAQTITLKPRAMLTLEGEIPQNATRLALRLEDDAFALDNACPFVREAPKPLQMAALGTGIPPWLVERLPKAIPRLSFTAPSASDFALVGLAADEAVPPVAGIHFSTAGKRDAPFLAQLPTAANHPLVNGLAWAGLSIQEAPAPQPQKGDEVLLWAGSRPLISLRYAVAPPAPTASDAEAEQDAEAESSPEGEAQAQPPSLPGGPQLILHFNPSLSNFERLPAAAILLLRFAETIRKAKTATTWAQLEPGQSLLPLVGEQMPSGTRLEFLDIEGQVLSSQPMERIAMAPKRPSYIRILNEDSVIVEGAVAFTDTRESNLLTSASVDTTPAAIDKAVRAAIPSENALLPLLSLAALATLLTLYHFQTNAAPKPRAKEPPPPASATSPSTS
ncbi:MAG: BatA domain-containing protein [Akkermansiaceae bacterium]|nr:BatA domain-containing protein [Akkermansiaceae bacterium]